MQDSPQPTRPPRPEPPGSPGSPAGQQKGDKKPGKVRRQLMPTVIMSGLILGAFLLYNGVRAARESLTAPAAKPIALPKNLGQIKIGLPDGWRQAKMQGVQNASGRWGIGKPGSTRYAMFITRYPLKASPKTDKEKKAVLAEAQRSLARTGAQGKKLKAKDYEQSGQKGWQYQFRTGSINIQIWLLLHRVEKRTSLYQFACQTPPGAKGDRDREDCQDAMKSLRFSSRIP